MKIPLAVPRFTAEDLAAVPLDLSYEAHLRDADLRFDVGNWRVWSCRCDGHPPLCTVEHYDVATDAWVPVHWYEAESSLVSV